VTEGPPDDPREGEKSPAAAPEGGRLVFPGDLDDPWTVSHRQVVTRPEDFALGERRRWQPPAPLDVATLRRALLPADRAALQALAPVSSVLVPIYDFEGELAVLLTRRSSSLSLDPGNISFPGGRVEAGENPLDAALREAEEEVGLERAAVEVLGCLDLVERVRDGQRVTSVVGLVHGGPELAPNPAEVEAALLVPLGALFAEGAAWTEHWGTARRAIRFFSHPVVLGEDLVWGLTARILWDLLERLEESAGGAATGD